MTERHNDIFKIIAQTLKKDENRMLSIEEPGNKEKNKWGWDSRIRLSYPLQNEPVLKDLSEEELKEDIKKRPYLWYYEMEDRRVNKKVEKVLALNLIEVTVPFGVGCIDWKFDEQDRPLLYEEGKYKTNTLESAKERKREKYEGIKYMANQLLTSNFEKLKTTYNIDKVEVIVKFIVVSSLGVVPKDTYKTIRRICRVCDRDSSQAANIMAKRMSITAIKRS
jgi:hypothetical protein